MAVMMEIVILAIILILFYIINSMKITKLLTGINAQNKTIIKVLEEIRDKKS